MERKLIRGGDINLFALNVLLMLAWAFFTGAWSLLSMFVGFVLGLIVLWLPRGLWGEVTYFRRFGQVIHLIAVFFYELVVSGVTVARLVLMPGLKFRSAIIAIPLDTRSDLEITIFANLISLTPGTLSLDVSDDRRTLYVHAMDSSDPEAEKAAVKRTFEKNIAEALE